MQKLILYRAVELVVGRSLAWKLGRWLYAGSRRELQNDPFVNGEYRLQAWLLDGLRKDGRASLLFIDVGANIGNWTDVLLAKLKASFSGTYRIHVFEPAPAQYATLTNRLGPQIADGTVIADRRGLAADSGRAYFNITGSHSGTSALEASSLPKPGSMEIEIATLDQVCAEQRYVYVDLVKIDTEGNDFNVISGARRMLEDQAIGMVQFEYNWRWIAFGHSLLKVFEFLDGRPYVLGKLSQTGIEVYGAWHPELDRYMEANYVLIHRDRLNALPHRKASFDGSNVPRLTAGSAGEPQ